MLWKPFNARFEDFIRDLQIHRQVVDTELTLLHINLTTRIIDQQELRSEQRELHIKQRALRTAIDDHDARLMQELQNERNDFLEQQCKGIFIHNESLEMFRKLTS